jgi:N-acetylglucosaminyldiphosphoundecaprenol N-acetyl-beta-D-mannosaminyltransferase
LEDSLKRLSFLNVPVDALELDQTLKTMESYLQDAQGHQIVLLTSRKLLRSRRDLDYLQCLRKSDLVLPVSKGVIKGARFQKKRALHRYNPFEFIIRLLGLAEKLDQSIYLLGSRKEELEQAEKNLKVSFPDLKVVGRYSGYFDKTMERNIVLAIRKASPGFLLVGRGVPDQDKWIARNRQHFNPGVYIWVDNCFEIFSGKERNISKQVFKMGMESVADLPKRPWKIFKIFPFLYFKLLVLIYRIRGL